MPKFKVFVTATVGKILTVQAETEEEALDAPEVTDATFDFDTDYVCDSFDANLIET